MTGRTFAVLTCACLTWGLLPTAVAHDCYGGHHSGGCRDCDSAHHWPGRASSSAESTRDTAASAVMHTIEGRISEVIYLPGVTADSGMVEVRVFGAGKSTLVRLAPAGLLKQKQIALREGDALFVTGYIVSGMDSDFLVATGIRSGERRVTLRDSRGRLIP
jgi:hypothetical protein